MPGKTKAEILESLNLGSSVAENDEHLESYFVPTVVLDDFLTDRYDLIRGAKGSGKSAILRMASRESSQYSELDDVKLIVATEHSGEPAFKRAFAPLVLAEVKDGALTDAWKTYLLNLALDALEELPDSDEKHDAIRESESCGLRFRSLNPFKKIWWSLLRMMHPKSVGITHEGGVSAQFPEAPPEIWTNRENQVDFPDLLRRVVLAFERSGKRCWVLIDRLDAAFQDQPELERRALRSLLVAYKDFMGHKALRVKLFFRTDLYDLVTQGEGFRELTHVADRASPSITWDPDKLLRMIMERFAFNTAVCQRYGFTKEEVADLEMRKLVFFSIFPAQINVGKQKGDSWAWMCSRIRDGNGVRTPRDLGGDYLTVACRWMVRL